MSSILNLKSYDIVITYSWNKNNQHGICGHTFEVIEYFWILKDHFNVCILIAENILLSEFLIAIKSKYNFTKTEIDTIISNTVFQFMPKLVLSNNILFTDGNLKNINSLTLIYKKLFLFSCGDISVKENTNKNVYVLQDHRIYDKAKVNSIEYVKKMLFDKFKKITKHDNKTLIYATKNCRILSDTYYEKLLSTTTDNYLVLTNEKNKLDIESDRITQIKLPVENIFEHFNKYLYTPIGREFDCSPRFIAECAHYGITVNYDVNYIDKGLQARQEDLKDLNNINLTHFDSIICIIKSSINI